MIRSKSFDRHDPHSLRRRCHPLGLLTIIDKKVRSDSVEMIARSKTALGTCVSQSGDVPRVGGSGRRLFRTAWHFKASLPHEGWHPCISHYIIVVIRVLFVEHTVPEFLLCSAQVLFKECQAPWTGLSSSSPKLRMIDPFGLVLIVSSYSLAIWLCLLIEVISVPSEGLNRQSQRYHCRHLARWELVSGYDASCDHQRIL